MNLLYKNYLKIWPSNSTIRRDRALFLLKTFEYNEAVEELEKLLVWEPQNTSLRRVLAYTYRKTGRYREAAVYLKALLREKPREISLLIEFTYCLERAGGAKYAIEVLEKAKNLFQNPDGKKRKTVFTVKASENISFALGIFYFRQKNIEKAFDCLRDAAALSPKDPRPYEWMAIIAQKYGGDVAYYKKEAKNREKFKNKVKK
jgi:tetratricopeptide (TPR) repeat protein